MPLDLPDGWCEELLKFCEKFPSDITLYEDLLSENRIWQARLIDVGVVSKELALSSGCSGVMLRASGVARDIRKEEPYLIYDELEFDVPYATKGDCYARYLLYMKRDARMRENFKAVR